MLYYKLIFILNLAAYTWEIEFPEDKHLIKSESRRKQYYYDYYQTETSYEVARKICKSRGDGWDLASFQAKPYIDRCLERSYCSATNLDSYDKSVKNIE